MHGSGARLLLVCAMSMTTEAFQQLLAELQAQNARNIEILQRQSVEALTQIVQQMHPAENFTDTRGVGRPVNFKGDERKYTEWKAKILAYLKVSIKESEDGISWASSSPDPISASSMLARWGTDAPKVE